MPVQIGPFARFPNRFFGSGLAAKLGPSAALIYLDLCDHANREGDNTFRVSDRALAADTGIGPRTITEARKALIERDLIKCTQEPGKSYQYTLRTPSLKWKPQKERQRVKDKPRGNRTAPAVDREELFLERAAIIEYCGNVSRQEAERLASEQLRAGGRARRQKAPPWGRKQHTARQAGNSDFGVAIFAAE